MFLPHTGSWKSLKITMETDWSISWSSLLLFFECQSSSCDGYLTSAWLSQRETFCLFNCNKHGRADDSFLHSVLLNFTFSATAQDLKHLRPSGLWQDESKSYKMFYSVQAAEGAVLFMNSKVPLLLWHLQNEEELTRRFWGFTTCKLPKNFPDVFSLRKRSEAWWPLLMWLNATYQTSKVSFHPVVSHRISSNESKASQRWDLCMWADIWSVWTGWTSSCEASWGW